MATKSHSTPDLFASKMACEQSKPQKAEHYISAPIYLSVLVTAYDSDYFFLKEPFNYWVGRKIMASLTDPRNKH